MFVLLELFASRADYLVLVFGIYFMFGACLWIDTYSFPVMSFFGLGIILPLSFVGLQKSVFLVLVTIYFQSSFVDIVFLSTVLISLHAVAFCIVMHFFMVLYICLNMYSFYVFLIIHDVLLSYWAGCYLY